MKYLYYYIGHIISKPMLWLDLGWLYPLYNNLMGKSVELDINHDLWRPNE